MTEQQNNFYRDFKFTNNNYIILCNIATYTKTKGGAGQCWKNKPDEIEYNVYKPLNYTYYISSIPFFDNFGGGASCHAKWSYTQPGYLPTTVTSISPGRDTKKIASFEFIPVERLKLNAGYRENYIIDNAKYYEMFIQDGIKYLKLITLNTDDKHAGVINLKNNKWVN